MPKWLRWFFSKKDSNVGQKDFNSEINLDAPSPNPEQEVEKAKEFVESNGVDGAETLF